MSVVSITSVALETCSDMHLVSSTNSVTMHYCNPDKCYSEINTRQKKEKQKLARAKIRLLSVLQFPDSYKENKKYLYLLVLYHCTEKNATKILCALQPLG